MPFPHDVDATWVNGASPGAVTYDAGELRRADAAMFAGAGSALGVGGGVVRHGDTSLSVSVDASDVVTVQPGAVVIPGNAVAGSGCYRTALGSAISGSLGARHATNSRIDLIVFRAMDTEVVGTHGAYTGRIDVVAGTASPTPSAPALPSMAVELARITVPATGGGTATVDSTYRTYATAIGGRVAAATFARLPASAPTRQRAIALDTGIEYEFDGSAWVTNGWVTMSLTAASGFSISTQRYRILDKWMVLLDLIVNRTGADITSTSLGNINPDVLVVSNLPSAIRPSTSRPVTFYRTSTSTGVAQGSMRVQANGEVYLTDMYPSITIDTSLPLVVHNPYGLG